MNGNGNEHVITGDEIAQRVSKLASQGVVFQDPMQMGVTYIRALLIYIIENTEGLDLVEAEQRYFQIMDGILTGAETAAIRQRIVGA